MAVYLQTIAGDATFDHFKPEDLLLCQLMRWDVVSNEFVAVKCFAIPLDASDKKKISVSKKDLIMPFNGFSICQ